ncbi:hypothetical protein DSO57_1039064 [Entomophthora muscae]|uniref:Uncharacterized protein n=1 Tax=Entomophthora muscae TaxID=34485 RepID=A0ACC2TX32_9FUNG|nr:hypothetical protein DSO57_1039064 [Entomophthora muscae]
MRFAPIIVWLLVQLEAAVFFTGKGGLSIFPAVSKGIHATSRASGKVVENLPPTRPEPYCRLARRGRRGRGHGMKRHSRRRILSQRRATYRRSQRNKEKSTFSHDHEHSSRYLYRSSFPAYLDKESDEKLPRPSTTSESFTSHHC